MSPANETTHTAPIDTSQTVGRAREIASESDSQIDSGKPQTTITPKNIRNKMSWTEQWGATIGALLWLTLCPGS